LQFFCSCSGRLGAQAGLAALISREELFAALQAANESIGKKKGELTRLAWTRRVARDMKHRVTFDRRSAIGDQAA
jgi:hypothetical protein